MHPRVLDEKKTAAQSRTIEFAGKIGERLGIDSELVSRLSAFDRDKEVQNLLRSEAVADLLESVHDSLTGVELNYKPVDVSQLTSAEREEFAKLVRETSLSDPDSLFIHSLGEEDSGKQDVIKEPIAEPTTKENYPTEPDEPDTGTTTAKPSAHAAKTTKAHGK